MLDINQLENIYRSFEIEGFQVCKYDKVPWQYYLPHREHSQEIINHQYSLISDHDEYSYFLNRVIEAINKKYNDDDNYFNYRIIQKDDLIEVLFIDEYCESYNGLTDESKESAIQYIMDHIKEKV